MIAHDTETKKRQVSHDVENLGIASILQKTLFASVFLMNIMPVFGRIPTTVWDMPVLFGASLFLVMTRGFAGPVSVDRGPCTGRGKKTSLRK